MSFGALPSVALALLVFVLASLRCGWANAQSVRLHGAGLHDENAHDGVYNRLDGDLDLGFGLGAELGSAGRVAPALRASAHYFSMAGLYLEGRMHSDEDAPRSLFGLGVDVRPLFIPRWSKGYERGPSILDLSLDSCSLSLGAFWTPAPPHALPAQTGRGFEAGLGFGLPLFSTAAGPWLETRAVLRYPDASAREEALIFTLSWHAFALTPLSASPASGL